MVIQWSIVATISAPIIALFVGVALNRAVERRSRLVTYLGHVSAHRVEHEGGAPFNVFTHSVVLKNAGRSSAHNVRLTHSILPTFNVHPGIAYEIERLPNGEIDIVIPVLVPRQEITISYLYYPPTTWDRINGSVKSDEGLAKFLTVLPAVRYPTWVNAIAGGLVLVGIVALLYVIVELTVRFW